MSAAGGNGGAGARGAAGEGGAPGGFVYSAPGLTYAALLAADPLLYPGAGESAPTCTTQDLSPLEGRVVDRLNALGYLYEQIATHQITTGSSANDAATMNVVAREIRLIGEHYGGSLDEADLGWVHAIVEEGPHTQNACGTTWQAPPRDASCPVSDALEGEFSFCERLLDSHVSAATAAAFMEYCRLAGQDVLFALDDAKGAPACAEPYRAAERAMTRDVLAKGLASPDGLVGNDVVGSRSV